ncbi:hypothetical protein KIL84_004548 [Mauremys mutica]|uniref:Essential for reactive oxygen species protein n=1 Tax=Mauremys mutica TaxID=74926 RepID=A0A9D3XNC7_9SAUR|nr:hypothetical protein KIL84_004548 [Mauremys mutica]
MYMLLENRTSSILHLKRSPGIRSWSLFVVAASLNEIRDVNVEEEKVRYFGKGYLVVLRFVTGFSHPLTQSAVLGCRSDVEAVAKLITGFLELNKVENHQDLSQSSETEASDADESKDEY